MFTFIMYKLNENPWMGPVLFGVICDIIVTIIIVGLLIGSRREHGRKE